MRFATWVWHNLAQRLIKVNDVGSSLALNVRSDDVDVLAVCFERDIKYIPEEGYKTYEPVNKNVPHHTRAFMPWNPSLLGETVDIARNRNGQGISNHGDESDNGINTEANFGSGYCEGFVHQVGDPLKFC